MLVKSEDIVVDEHGQLDVVRVGVVKVEELLHFLEAQLVHVNFGRIDEASENTQHHYY